LTTYMITGGAGFVGSQIADLLVKDHVGDIIIFDNFIRGRLENLAWARSNSNGRLTIVDGDVRDRNLLEERMKGVDVLFHQAAIRITQCAEEPRLALEVLADGTFNVLDAARKAGVQRVIAASSASVYGAAEEFPTRESHHPYNNRTIYGAAKVFNEGLLRSFFAMYGLNYVALRYFNAYGPRMDMHGAYTEVFIRWMERIAAGQPPLIFGDGKQTMDFVYVEDIARANILAARSTLTNDVFNIGSGTETSLKDLAHALLAVMGSTLQPEFGPERKVNPVPRRLADVSRAKRFLGFEASVSFEAGLRRLVEWWRGERTRT
jgi:UDP-glucose 4-epimerase